MRPSLHIDDLPAETQEVVRGLKTDRRATSRGLAPIGPPKRKGSDKRDESAIAQKRGRTGAAFEAELNIVHRAYEFQQVAKIWPHSPPFVFVKGAWTPKAGGGPVDRTGHVRLLRGIDATVSGRAWRASPVGEVVPIAFDAKVLGKPGATYKHEQKKQHQLHQLRDAAHAGVFAFLLVHAAEIDRVFLLPIEQHFAALISGRGVTLFERDRGVPGGASHPVTTFYPSIERTTPTLTRFGPWDWVPLLEHVPNPPGAK